jgi:hypothetical protein
MGKLSSASLAFGTCLTAFAACALAGQTSRDVAIEGNVAKFCSIDGALALTEVTDGITVTGDKVTLANFTGPDGRHPGLLFRLKFPGTICNYKSQFSLASANGSLENKEVAEVAGTGRKVLYTVTGYWDGVEATLDADGSGPVQVLSSLTTSFVSGNLELEFQTQPSLPLQGGLYSDVLTVSLQVAN